MDIKVTEDYDPTEIRGKNPSSYLLASGGPRCFLLCEKITPISASVFTLPSFLCVCFYKSSPLEEHQSLDSDHPLPNLG